MYAEDILGGAGPARRPTADAIRRLRAGRVRIGLVALDDAHRGNLVLRKTLTLGRAGSGTVPLVIGALQTGRYRLVLIDAAGRAWRASREIRVVSAATWPPANSGCGDDGPTQSASVPTVRLTSASLRLRDTGRARIYLRGNQTAAMTVTIAQVGGKRVGGTTPANTPAPPRPGTASWLRRSMPTAASSCGEMAGWRSRSPSGLINGSGATNTRVLSGVIRPV